MARRDSGRPKPTRSSRLPAPRRKATIVQPPREPIVIEPDRVVAVYGVDHQYQELLGLVAFYKDHSNGRVDGTQSDEKRTGFIFDELSFRVRDELGGLLVSSAPAEASHAIVLAERNGLEWLPIRRRDQDVPDEDELRNFVHLFCRGVRLAFPSWVLLGSGSSPTWDQAPSLNLQQMISAWQEMSPGRDWYNIRPELEVAEGGNFRYKLDERTRGWAHNNFKKLVGPSSDIRRRTKAEARLEALERLEDSQKGLVAEDEPAEEAPRQELVDLLMERVDRVSDPLGRLLLLDQLYRDLPGALVERMIESAMEFREDGGTWRRIGEAFGTTPQNAQQRFDPVARARSAEKARRRREEGKQT